METHSSTTLKGVFANSHRSIRTVGAPLNYDWQHCEPQGDSVWESAEGIQGGACVWEQCRYVQIRAVRHRLIHWLPKAGIPVLYTFGLPLALLYVDLNPGDFKKLGEISPASVTTASRTSLSASSSLRQTTQWSISEFLINVMLSSSCCEEYFVTNYNGGSRERSRWWVGLSCIVSMSEVVDEKDERAYVKGTDTQLEGKACGVGLPASIRFQLVCQAPRLQQWQSPLLPVLCWVFWDELLWGTRWAIFWSASNLVWAVIRSILRRRE